MNTNDTMTGNSSPEVLTDFQISLKMESDWHIGSGTGRRGDIDRMVKRDRVGLPYLPAKTIVGVWRDACELLANGLNEGDKNRYFSKLVNYLFGDQPALAKGAIAESPREAALSVRAAHFPDPLRDALKDKPLLKEAIAFVKPGIKIDYENGCAIEDCLRFEEVVRGGITLKADCHLNLPEDAHLKELSFAFLVAGTGFIEKIGGKRRRGNGKCAVEVDEADRTKCVSCLGDYLEKQTSDNIALPEIPEIKKEPASDFGTHESPKQQAWKTIRLQIEALSPIVVAERTVGNVVETLDYIPGTYLLRLVRRQFGKHNPALGSQIDGAIAHNDLVVTNATIAIDDRQGYPTPFTISGEKLGGGLGKGKKIYNRFVENLSDAPQLKGERGGYLTCEIADLKMIYPNYEKVDVIAETHNIVDDAEQRPNENTGGVYTYEAIAAGTIFQAEIRLHEKLADEIAKTLEEWKNILDGEAAIGQSKKDDYGKVTISVLSDESASIPKAEQNTLMVWLLSDVLLRDERLRPTTDFCYLKKELEKELGVKLKLPIEKVGIARSHRIDSWQVRWQLPRPSLVGLGAGSCIRFEIDSGTLDLVKLAEIEQSGIGERRAEGYGQVCFNHPLLAEKLSDLKRSKDSESGANGSKSASRLVKDLVGEAEFSYAEIVQKAAWSKAIQERALALTSTPEKRQQILGINGKKPDNTQLGALRSVLSRLREPTDEKPTDAGMAIAWLTHLELIENRKNKWNSESLELIRKYLVDRDFVWQVFELDYGKLTLTTNGEKELKRKLWAKALYALVDACIRAHKRHGENNLEEEQN